MSLPLKMSVYGQQSWSYSMKDEGPGGLSYNARRETIPPGALKLV